MPSNKFIVFKPFYTPTTSDQEILNYFCAPEELALIKKACAQKFYKYKQTARSQYDCSVALQAPVVLEALNRVRKNQGLELPQAWIEMQGYAT